jgi:hypothetical protein
LRLQLSIAFISLVVVAAAPAFMLRVTGVMDDSVFWVVAKSLDSGKVLYRDVFFTQPPLFILIPQALWMATTNLFVHRAFLFAVWLTNGYLLFLILARLDLALRLLATGLFLVSAFILQSYALHTEIFILSLFLIGTLAVTRRVAASSVIVGLAASASFFVKPLGPMVFAPCLYYILLDRTPRTRQLAYVLGAALVPVVAIATYLVANGTAVEFWHEVVLDNSNIGLLVTDDWQAYAAMAVAPLLVPLFAVFVIVDRRPSQFEWWLTAVVFVVLLVIELLRGARHYGLLNLAVLVWMAVRAQDKLTWRIQAHRITLGALVALAAVFHLATVREILARGSVTNELSDANFVQALPPGSLQVFGNNPPRIYMLLNRLVPAYSYVFVYDTNKELVIWDNYTTMINTSPPDYIAVEDDFRAVEYGQLRSTQLTNATAVKEWITHQANYRQLDVGQSLGLTLFQHLGAQEGLNRAGIDSH